MNPSGYFQPTQNYFRPDHPELKDGRVQFGGTNEYFKGSSLKFGSTNEQFRSIREDFKHSRLR